MPVEVIVEPALGVELLPDALPVVVLLVGEMTELMAKVRAPRLLNLSAISGQT
jgi:hypothetical protein